MNTLTLYKNSKPYPYYSENALTVFKTLTVTPLNQNLKSGFVDLQLGLDDLLNFNYLSYSRNGKTVYAWVSEVEKMSGGLNYRVHFAIDAFRTFKSSLDLDVQWVKRDMYETTLPDPLLSSLKSYPNIERYEQAFPDAGIRTLIVQVREDTNVEFPYTGLYKSLPVQPSPYNLYMAKYNTNTWVETASNIVQLMQGLGSQAQTTNIVTIYSAPGDLVGANSQDASIKIRYASEDSFFAGLSGENTKEIAGFFKWGSTQLSFTKDSVKLAAITDINTMLRGKHDVRVVIPGAGIMNIPDELLLAPNASLVRYVDVYSGATHYAIEAGEVNDLKPYDASLREGGAPSIPILSSSMDSYISQNQNSMMTQILGDTAMIGGAIAAGIYTGGASLPASAPLIAGSVGNLINTTGNVLDANRQAPSNPPAMLGAALTPHYDGKFWMIVTRQDVTNADQVHAKYGYPQNVTKALRLPITGFIQTQGCIVKTTNAIPLWAIDEINRLFDNGIIFS